MSEDVPLHGATTLVITTSDRTLFSCMPHEVGGLNVPRQLRWKLIGSDGTVYIGPRFHLDESDPDAVQRLVSEWWESKKGARPGRP